MGNQLAAIAPSQIFPVEYYLTELPDYQFDASLGSTRFFKVAKAKFREGPVVVKVFAVHDPTLPLKAYKDQIEACKLKLENAPNCLPFKKSLSTDKAELLFRQYVKDNLYDRISTRPFLSNLEKKWIAFQILCAINQSHKAGICHGDIKLENIMVTSWNWVLLTDFASFKPTYLPEDNPADFSYFFDTSRRRTCYVAPERFIKTLSADFGDASSGARFVLTDGDYWQGDISPAMDIFSVGCVICELFTEGHAPFDFSQLLSYRNGDYSPSKVVEKIDDVHIKEMVLHMIQRDPAKRLSAESYLEMELGKAFPSYFYTFLSKYMQGFLMPYFVSPQDKIQRLQKDLDSIIFNLKMAQKENGRNHVDGLVIIVSLVTSCLRAVMQCSGKLQVLNILQRLVPFLSDEITLDRLLPYMLQSLDDPFPQVRASALEILAKSLADVKSVSQTDATIFPDYVLPQLEQKAQDDAVLVRVSFARNIAILAETALRFLEVSQIEYHSVERDEESQPPFQTSYDSELQSLHEIIQQTVATLLTDPDNIVRQTLLEFGITRLCIFFGRKKANDVILSHMITVLNDKEDRHLRGAFFDSIVGVAAYIGWQCCPLIKPLLQQGFCDEEEFVTSKALCALSSLTELGLFQKHILYDLLVETSPFVCHPNIWIRNNAAGFICAAAKTMNIADTHCKLIPLIEPFLKYPIIQIHNEMVLLSSLIDPVPRSIMETVIRCKYMDALMETLKERQSQRRYGTSGSRSASFVIIEPLKQVFRRLSSDGMTTDHEDEILSMRDYLIKLHKAKCRQEERQKCMVGNNGVVNLEGCKVRRWTVELKHTEKLSEIGSQEIRINGRKALGNDSSTVMNEEWQHMFGTPDSKLSAKSQDPSSVSGQPHGQMGVLEGHSSRDVAEISLQDDPTLDDSSRKLKTQSQQLGDKTHESVVPLLSQFPVGSSESGGLGLIHRYADCKLDLNDLIDRRRSHYIRNVLARETAEEKARIRKQLHVDWKPKGTLVAHLHEHKAAVNRVLVLPETTLFATCSNDGTVKIWDCDRMEKKSISNRSRQTYSRPDCQFVSLEVCQSFQSLACASNNGAIHVFRLESSTAKITTAHTRMLHPQDEGTIVDMNYFDSGSQSVLTYATTYGLIVGWDLRAPGNAWKLESDPKHGLLTSYCIDERQCWLAVGTSNGAHICWDLRFRLPVSNINHCTGARVRRMAFHPQQHSWVVSAVQGNNEVALWDMETETRKVTLWASPVPPLSQTESSDESILCFCLPMREGAPGIITAGSDSRIRYWDFSNPNENYVIVGAADDYINPSDVSYRSQFIDGAEVIKEIWNKPRSGNEDMPRRGPDAPPSGHLDCISDIAIHQTTQWLLLSAARDGVVKVWK